MNKFQVDFAYTIILPDQSKLELEVTAEAEMLAPEPEVGILDWDCKDLKLMHAALPDGAVSEAQLKELEDYAVEKLIEGIRGES
jgi:hypothetical protein